MSLQKKSEWAEDVACKVTDIIFNRKAGWSGVLEKYLSEKFSQAISNREKEIAEEVEKKSFRGSSPYEQHYLIKKGDVLSILKH